MIMIPALKKTRIIHAFTQNAIPSPRDLFAKYGERRTPNAIYTTDGETVVEPVPSSTVPIRQMKYAQQLVTDAVSRNKETDEGIKKKH